uniref:Uncharacterized protein n=1 Tax=Panagrolaimus sp. PS1159 TaxID=55785 RepID=A0AC35FM40_9BILA
MKGDITTFIKLEQLPQAYRKKLEKIEENFKADRNSNIQQKLLDTFSNNYLMPAKIWCKLIELYFINIRGGTTSAAQIENLRQRALYQFFHDVKNKMHDECESFINHPSELRKLLNTDPKLNKYKTTGEPFIKMKEEQLKYPNKSLDEIFKFYERHIYSTPSTSLMINYCKMKNFYAEIKVVENDIDKWFQKLLEVKDHQFIVHNVEYRLGKNLNDLTLWKLYIKYLRDTDPKEMLQLYSKYCRYFIDDNEMLEKYKTEVKNFGPVFVKWQNPFNFEHQITSDLRKMVNRFNHGLRRPATTLWLPESTCPLHIGDGYSYQNFSLPNNIIYFMLKSSNYIVLQKLHISCKYFFAKKPTPICYNFEYYCSNETSDKKIYFVGQSIKLNVPYKNLDNLKRFYVANSLKLYPKNQGIQSIIQRMNLCEPRHIRIKKQAITEKEFEYLVGHGKVETLSLKKVKIFGTNGEIIPLENVMDKLPKIRELRLDYIRVTSETANILCQLPFENKIKSIKIFRINNLLNLETFFCFLNNIIHSQARLDFSCSKDAGDDFVWEFKRHENLFEKQWNDKKGKPMIAVFSSFEYKMLSQI